MHLPLAGLHRGSLSRQPRATGRLRSLDGIGSNPGNLKVWHFTPEPSSEDELLPLVVVLHGCTQTAEGYDRGSGWSELAAAYGFAVLFPEQQRANNPNLCFNWFEPADTRRGGGEAQSIAEAIETMIERHRIDRQRVYITGLSAGGAMTSAMLALYPEMFAGGAILAGLPHGAAATVQEAFQQMRIHSPSSRTTGGSITAASRHRGPWPAVSIWHGTADTVVSPSNADAIARQWKEVHGVSGSAYEDGLADGHPHRAWRAPDGRIVVEEYRVTGMGHGTPLSTDGDCGCGEAGAFMLEAGISSTVRSARTWSLLENRRSDAPIAEDTPPAVPNRALDPLGAVQHRHWPAAAPAGQASHLTSVIEQALRTAGLMK